MKLVNKCILSRFIAPGFRLALRADWLTHMRDLLCAVHLLHYAGLYLK